MKKCNGKSYENVLGYTFICVTDEKMTTVIGDSALVSEYPSDSQFYILMKQQLENHEKQQKLENVAGQVQEIKKRGFVNWFKSLFNKELRTELGYSWNWDKFFRWWR